MLKLPSDKGDPAGLHAFHAGLAERFGKEVADAVIDEIEMYVELGEARGVAWVGHRLCGIAERASQPEDLPTKSVATRLARKVTDKATEMHAEVRFKLHARAGSKGRPS